jgi:hypothetical protein
VKINTIELHALIGEVGTGTVGKLHIAAADGGLKLWLVKGASKVRSSVCYLDKDGCADLAKALEMFGVLEAKP